MPSFHAERYLKEFQLSIYNESLTRFFNKDNKGFGLCVPVGGGKTFLTLAFTSYLKSLETRKKPFNGTVVILSLTLIQSWEAEIKKFNKIIKNKNKEFPDDEDDQLTYYIAHKDYEPEFEKFSPLEDFYDIVITTKENARSVFSEFNLEAEYISKEPSETGRGRERTAFSRHAKVMPDCGFLYSKKWSFVVVDEFHEYMKIQSSIQSKAMCYIPGKYKCALSGTMFNNPTGERALAFFTFIEVEDEFFPTNVPDAGRKIKEKNFPGMKEYCVVRTNEEIGIDIDHTVHRIVVEMSQYEKLIYKIFSDITDVIITRKRQAKKDKDNDINGESVKLLSDGILVLILYVRECLIAPIIPISTFYMKSLFANSTDEKLDLGIQEMINIKFKEHDVYNYFDKRSSILSKRIKGALKIANEEQNKKVIIFSAFRKTLDLILHATSESDRVVETLTSKDDAKTRGKILKKLSNEDSFILLLTYKLGSVGLNLQFADCVICIDYTFDPNDTQQSVGRAIRPGQTNNVNVYYLCSDTYLENIILEKHIGKRERGKEILEGAIKSSVAKISSDQICEIISSDKNLESIRNAIKWSNNTDNKIADLHEEKYGHEDGSDNGDEFIAKELYNLDDDEFSDDSDLDY